MDNTKRTQWYFCRLLSHIAWGGYFLSYSFACLFLFLFLSFCGDLYMFVQLILILFERKNNIKLCGSGDEKDLGATWGGENHDQDMLYEKTFAN